MADPLLRTDPVSSDPVPSDPVSSDPVSDARSRGRLRGLARPVLTALAFVLVWFALIAPNRLEQLTPGNLVRIPIEGLVLVGVGLALPGRARRAFAAAVGLLLGLLCVIKILDLGYYEELNRPFNPVIDWSSLSPALGVLRDSIGRSWADVAAVGAGLLVLGIVCAVALSVLRLSRITAQHRRASLRAIGVLGVLWLACALLGAQLVPGTAVASRSATALAAEQIRNTRAAVRDQQRFETALNSSDSYQRQPADTLLTGLRGKDVIVAFVESYGEVAVRGSSLSAGVDSTLADGTRTLAGAGFTARSAMLDSPTFGGISWLAHSTLQSGLWVDNQRRYDQLVASDRFTLSDAFKRAGWRTVSDVPSDTKPWPEGTSFYHYDQLYDERNVGYAGPKFSYASMPDQYTLAAFQRLELTAGHAPVMAEIDLVSSHTPWTPLPRMVDPSRIGNGSVFDGMPEQGPAPSVVWPNANRVRGSYGQSIQYSLNALVSFVTTSHDDNLVLVLLGDHQPATIVSGTKASHRVPISIVAHDPKVLSSISDWGWTDGLLPGPGAPVWPMDAFRNRFLTAYGSPAAAAKAAGGH
jgi:hypothetical protein